MILPLPRSRIAGFLLGGAIEEVSVDPKKFTSNCCRRPVGAKKNIAIFGEPLRDRVANSTRCACRDRRHHFPIFHGKPRFHLVKNFPVCQ